jgi:L-Lysine epsilon oxidase N-terminal/L-lysine epsilon oxidase C-terminal domain/Iron-containing redox enzyme
MADKNVLRNIAYARIFPPIGIARVGNSQESEGYFIGPEWPNQRLSADKSFRYKDAHGALKRQAARFRVYAFDSKGRAIAELTSQNAEITWTVSLANRKASWFRFSGAHRAILHFNDPGHEPPARLTDTSDPDFDDNFVKRDDFVFRNESVGRPTKGGKWDRKLRDEELSIQCEKQTLCGPNLGHSSQDRGKWAFTGSFLKKNTVYLGELRTDEEGRVFVLGGHGISAGYNSGGDPDPNNWITHYANNDWWHDDTSDGPVSASVKLKDGTLVEVRGAAHVICAPPDFAPDTGNLVTLFDAMQQAAVDHSLKSKELDGLFPDGKTEYHRDIEPMLQRIQGYSWVSGLGLRGHGPEKSGEFLTTKLIRLLKDPNSAEGSRQREAIFSMIRKPPAPDVDPEQDDKDPERIRQASMYFMPPLSGDEGTRVSGVPSKWLTVTRLQYEHFRRWSENNFETGPELTGTPHVPPRDLQTHPQALTRSVLDRCVGGAFYPGIEMTAIVRVKELYVEAFRIASNVGPGEITQHMACPWQADFFECNSNWWPGQRPDESVNEFDLFEVRAQFPTERAKGDLPKLLFPRQQWARSIDIARPNMDSLVSSCLLVPHKGEQAKGYFERQLKLFVDAWENYIFTVPDGLPNPWRMQFLIQEDLDRYSSRHVQFRMPTPEEFVVTLQRVRDKGDTLAALRAQWPSVPVELKLSSDEFLQEYLNLALKEFRDRLSRMLEPLSAKTSAEIFETLQRLNDLGPDDPPTEVSFGTVPFAQFVFVELCQAVADMKYEELVGTAGDNGMVQHWKDLGFIVERYIHKEDETPSVVYVETERSVYDGLKYRDYFHILMNIEKYPGFFEYSLNIVEQVLNKTQRLIESKEVANSDIIEKAFTYTPSTFAAKLEEIYEHFRKEGAATQPWLNDNTRDETIRWRLLRNAQFNQVDGSWLRFIADAGPIDEIHAVLFEVWSDEVGNGDPSLHHGNLYTALLRSLGVYLPDLESAEYAASPLLREEDFFNPVFQLCISQHAKRYFAEILGMTLYLEWEVLDLVSGVKNLDYLGFDTQFWQMHVGIDNAANGHGAKARQAVELHLANVLNEGGEGALQAEWQRVWRGFVAFATAESGYLGADRDVERRRPRKVADRMADVVVVKAHYARLQHARRRLGPDRLNDLFDEPDKLLSALRSSQWIKAGDPGASKLLTYLTTFEGPMYKVFNPTELNLWREWIEWLGREGSTEWATSYFNKEESFVHLLRHLAATAASQAGHQRHALQGSLAKNKDLASWFQEALNTNNFRSLMDALATPQNGYVIPYGPEVSNLVLEYLRTDRPMGRALDRRFPDINNQIGRKIIVDWIVCGCPVNGKVSKGKPRFHPARVTTTTFVEELGKGSVH